MPYPIATITPFERKDEFDSGDYQATLDRCLAEIDWAEKSKLQGRLIDGPLSRPRDRLLHRGRRRRPEGNARLVLEPRRRGHRGLCRLLRGRPGRRDRVRADRRRRARGADRPHPQRVPRLDRLCERRLRRLSLARGGDGRLGAPRRRRQPARAIRAGRPQRLACAPAEIEIVDGAARWSGRPVVRLAGLSPTASRPRALPQQEAHLHLRRACRPCGGRPQDRPRADRSTTWSSRTAGASSIR